MSGEQLEDFDAKSADKTDPEWVETEYQSFFFNVLPHLTEKQGISVIRRVTELGLIPQSEAVEVSYGADFDIANEVEGLIQSVRAMQGTVMDPDGRVKPGISPREMKEVVTATSSLMSLLMKSHEKLMTFERQRSLEQSTVEVLQEMGGEEIVSRFVELMEARLEEG